MGGLGQGFEVFGALAQFGGSRAIRTLKTPSSEGSAGPAREVPRQRKRHWLSVRTFDWRLTKAVRVAFALHYDPTAR